MLHHYMLRYPTQSGKITRYELSITVSLELTNLDDNIKINKSFVRSGDYNVAVIHSDTINNEKNLTKNLNLKINYEKMLKLNITYFS